MKLNQFLSEDFKRASNEDINKFISQIHNMSYEQILNKAENMLAGGHVMGDISLGFRGSSRMVYMLPGYRVLKLRSDENQHDSEAGEAQNQAEIEMWQRHGDKEIMAEVYDYDNVNYSWLIMETAKQCSRMNYDEKNNKFKARYPKLGMSYTDFILFLSNLMDDKLKDLSLYKDIKPFSNWVKIKTNSDFAGDLVEDNMGFTKDGRLVCIDYGLSNEIYQDYYN
jgi:isocitrate dehydrogenase kinase/phosphatase